MTGAIKSGPRDAGAALPKAHLAPIWIAANDATQAEKGMARTSDGVICDGVADEVEINALLTANTLIELSSGTFTLAATMTAAVAGVHIKGQGSGKTTVTLVNSADVSVITVGGDNWTVEGLTIDGNSANQSSQSDAISIDDKNNGRILDVGITDIRNDGIRLWGSGAGTDNWLIDRLDAHDNGIVGADNSHIEAYKVVTNITIQNSLFGNITAGTGTHIVCNGDSSDECEDWKLLNNVHEGTHQYVMVNITHGKRMKTAFCEFKGTSANQALRYDDIIGGTIIGCTFGTVGDTAISIYQGCEHVSVIGCYVTGTLSHGMEITDGVANTDCKNISVIGCTFYNIGTQASQGIHIGAGDHDGVTIVGCTFEDDRGTRFMDYGVYYTGASLNNVISGNIFIGMDIAAVVTASYGDYLLISNNAISGDGGGEGITLQDGNDITVAGNTIQNCTNPVGMNDATVVRTYIYGNNWQGCTNDIAVGASVPTFVGENIGKDGRIWQPSLDGTQVKHVARATYSYADDGGAVSTIGLGVYLPDNAIVTRAWYEVITTLTSNSANDAATVALTIPTDDANGIVAAIAINDGTDPWDSNSGPGGTGYHDAIQDGLLGVTNFSAKTTAERELSIVIGVEAIDAAGIVILFCEYVVSD